MRVLFDIYIIKYNLDNNNKPYNTEYKLPEQIGFKLKGRHSEKSFKNLILTHLDNKKYNFFGITNDIKDQIQIDLDETTNNIILESYTIFFDYGIKLVPKMNGDSYPTKIIWENGNG